MIFAKNALLTDGWRRNVRITAHAGVIVDVACDAHAESSDTVVDCAIPGMSNLHSHAFQRGFSGLTEQRGSGRDSFWTWREMMYRFALSLDPDGVQALAELAFCEMLEAGYTRVGEFHYLHHAPDGRPYANPAEMSERIFAAAEEVGIALTHLPVFYAHSGFGGLASNEGQRRFIHGLDDFATLIEACDKLCIRPQDRVGYAPHSLRAATLDEVQTLQSELDGRPVHIHVAEQVKEVEDCLAHHGARPVELLMNSVEVDATWCLIHATHLTPMEVEKIARSGAVAGLCPVTEANLGDGVFPAADYLARGGALGIGTDSNVRIDLAEEIRLLEYGQRLTLRGRNVLAEEGRSTAVGLFEQARAGGGQALGAGSAAIAPGAPCDIIGLRDQTALDHSPDALVDRWIFGKDVTQTEVWAHGRHLVSDGRHRNRLEIMARAAKVVRQAIT